MRKNKKVITIFIFVSTWLCGVYFLLKNMAEFSFTPGQASSMKSDFPKNSALKLSQGKMTLVTFMHPLCGCSQATLDNLKDLLKQWDKSKADVKVVFFVPKKLEEDWKKSDLVGEAKKLGLDIAYDESGAEFRRFDAKTSGQTFLFSRDGHLLFKGGLTEERGHAGPVKVVQTIAGLVKADSQRFPASSVITTNTYGCENLDSE